MPEASATDARKKASRLKVKETDDNTSSTTSSEAAPEFPMAVGMKAGTDAVRRMMEIGADMTRFYTSHLGKQMGYMAELATCRNPTDFFEVYSRAVSEAAEDAAVQFDRLSSINNTDFAFTTRPLS